MRIKTCFIIFLFICGSFQAQNSLCSGAQLFCPNLALTFPAGVNAGSAQGGPNYGCLVSQPNPAWFYVNVSGSGSLTATFSANNDIDFICYGPFNNLFGACNNLTATNIIGCSYSGSATETLTIPNGQIGEYYLIMITNFSNANQNITVTQINGSGSLDCNYLPLSYTSVCGTGSGTITSPQSALSNVNYTLQPGGFTSTTPTFVIAPLVNTTYSLFCSGVNSQSIVQTFSGTIGINYIGSNTPTLIPYSSSPTICVGQSVTIDVIATSTYTWSNGVINSNFMGSPSVTTSFTVTADSLSGCTGSAVVTQYVDLCTTTSGQTLGAGMIFVHPNPALSYFYIGSETGEAFEITGLVFKDILGRSYQINAEIIDRQKLKVSFNSLTPGPYFIFFEINGRVLVEKLIVTD